jgi:hypothetical protein
MKIDQIEQLFELVEKLQTQGADHNQLLLSIGHGYCLIRGKKGSQSLEIELANGRAIKKMEASKNPQKIKELGFRARKTAAENDKRELHFDQISLLHNWLTKLWQALPLLFTGRNDFIFAKLFLGTHDHIDHESLIQGMRALSTERTWSARQKVYWRLARGEFLLALKPSLDFYSLLDDPSFELDQEQIESELMQQFQHKKQYLMTELDQMSSQITPLICDFISGYQSIAIFSDYQQLKLFEPRGLPYLRITGSLLIYYFIKHKYASLLINPRGIVGGELYANEIASIYDIISKE